MLAGLSLLVLFLQKSTIISPCYIGHGHMEIVFIKMQCFYVPLQGFKVCEHDLTQIVCLAVALNVTLTKQHRFCTCSLGGNTMVFF